MTSNQPIQAFRSEHRELLEHIEHIRATGRELRDLDRDAREMRRERILGFLRNVLVPHAESEEAHLYPEIGRILGDARATATMSYDHVAIRRRIEELAEVDVGDTQRCEELLYGLYALITVHFAKEEEVYLPILEQEPEDRVRELFERMMASGHDHPPAR